MGSFTRHIGGCMTPPSLPQGEGREVAGSAYTVGVP
jgi:hypothetical protein